MSRGTEPKVRANGRAMVAPGIGVYAPAGTPLAPEPARAVSGVGSEVARLSLAADSLEKAFAALLERLTPVQTNSASPEPAQTTEATPQSHLAEQLRAQSDRVDFIAIRLLQVIDSLDI